MRFKGLGPVFHRLKRRIRSLFRGLRVPDISSICSWNIVMAVPDVSPDRSGSVVARSRYIEKA